MVLTMIQTPTVMAANLLEMQYNDDISHVESILDSVKTILLDDLEGTGKEKDDHKDMDNGQKWIIIAFSSVCVIVIIICVVLIICSAVRR